MFFFARAVFSLAYIRMRRDESWAQKTYPKPSRAWCFTKFDYTTETIEQYKKLASDDYASSVRYIVFGEETCPETGKPHLQGYLELKKPSRGKAVKVLLDNDEKSDVHLEHRYSGATREQAKAYCLKEGKPHEAGNWKSGGQGARCDLHRVADLIANDAPIEELIEKHPIECIRYHRGIEWLKARFEKKRARDFRKLEVDVFWGDAGTGKTKKALDEHPDAFTVNAHETFPFEGYDGEKTILIDDFEGHLKYSFLLRILDGHRLRLNTKGGHRWALFTRVIITSNKSPDQWYKRGLTPALKRRLTTVTEFRNKEDGNTMKIPSSPPQTRWSQEEIDALLDEFASPIEVSPREIGVE